eukprot:5197137-Pleurochrysis_carterae.AAC.1
MERERVYMAEKQRAADLNALRKKIAGMYKQTVSKQIGWNAAILFKNTATRQAAKEKAAKEKAAK